MTLSRLIAAMALRALTTRLEQRLDPVVTTIVGAVGYATGGGWDVDSLLTVPAAVGELGARVSGVVAGCGCTDASSWACEARAPYDEPCHCPCHEAAHLLRVALAWVDIRDDVRAAVRYVSRAREALAARPKPEAEGTYELVDLLSYGVTAPGGCS